MPHVIIRDDGVWATHVDGSPELVARILGMAEDARVVLIVEGTPVRFAKMRDGADGRPTPGLRPADPEAARAWGAFRARRRERVAVKVQGDARPSGAYLRSLAPMLSEWDVPEDAAAYDRL